MPRLRRLAASIVLLAAMIPASARADDPPPATPEQHLANGAKLFEDENYAAARAELEAAYRSRPSAAALLEIARCERALFRHPQAIAAIERALREHGAAMPEADRRAAESALAELRATLGAVQVEILPAGATLRIDGEDQPAGPSQRLIPLGPGTHRLEARLEGHAPAAQTLTLTSGDTMAVKLRLVPASVAAAAASKPAGSGRGLYVLGAVNLVVPLPPSEFSGAGPGFSVGARVGYRLAPVVGAEVGFEYARASVGGEGEPTLADTPGATYPLAYTLSSFRAGLHVRLMTTGERVRFVQTFGGGVMADAMTWKAGAGAPPRQDASGANGFGLSETGVELDLRGVLLGLTLQTMVGSSGGLTHPRPDAYSSDTYGGPQLSLGLGLRGGYRFW